MEFGVHSEIGKLRSVLMHRPGEEIKKVTKETLQQYHFRAVPNLTKMQAEFDDFTTILKNNNVKVVLLESLTEKTHSPNLYFTRDIASITEKGLVVMNMAVEARKGEPKIIKEALKKEIPVHVEIKKPGLLEGGDLVFIDDDTIGIGFGPRSNIQGIKKLIGKFKKTSIKEFVLIPLPSFRVHLDGAFMFVGHHLTIIHEPSISHQRAQIITGNTSRKEPFLDYLRWKGIRTITVSDEETKNFSPNVFSIGAGKVISYEWNTRVIKELEKRGLDVIPIKGKELVKGGGGPHCMTCPILRD